MLRNLLFLSDLKRKLELLMSYHGLSNYSWPKYVCMRLFNRVRSLRFVWINIKSPMKRMAYGNVSTKGAEKAVFSR